MEAIELFMWGYQRCFQISVENEAEKLFQVLDPGFEVETFLLGLPLYHPSHGSPLRTPGHTSEQRDLACI